MQKVDRLVWADGLSFRAYGLRIGVRVNDPAALPRVVALLPPGWKPATSPIVDRLYSVVVAPDDPGGRVRRFNLLYDDFDRIARTHEPAEVYAALENVLHLHVAEFARRRLFVHAGVVGWQGRAIVLPGRSFVGKSTLVSALLRAGATYYSDEFAVFDEQGRVHPFARPLALRGDDGAPVERRTGAEFGAPTGKKPLPVGLIAFAEYRAGGHWRPRPVPAGRAVLALLENTVPARHRPGDAFRIFGRIATRVPVMRGSRGEADEVARTLLATIANEHQTERPEAIEHSTGQRSVRQRVGAVVSE